MYDFNGDSATIYTGASDVSKSGTIENYNQRPYLPQWPSAPCNKVTGASDGTKFPSLSDNGTQMMFFRKSLCRAIPMVCIAIYYYCEPPVAYCLLFLIFQTQIHTSINCLLKPVSRGQRPLGL